MPTKAPTKAPTRASAATMRTRTARDDRGRDTSSAFATPHTHGRTSFICARSKISLTFWESSGDAGQGRNSTASSASRRGRTAPSSASSPMTRLLLSLNRSLSATIASGISLRSSESCDLAPAPAADSTLAITPPRPRLLLAASTRALPLRPPGPDPRMGLPPRRCRFRPGTD